jgi:hypothetical protein
VISIIGEKTLLVWSERMKQEQFPNLETQKYNSVSEFSAEWNEFVFYESARAAEQIGYGLHPLAFFNDVLYT